MQFWSYIAFENKTTRVIKSISRVFIQFINFRIYETKLWRQIFGWSSFGSTINWYGNLRSLEVSISFFFKIFILLFYSGVDMLHVPSTHIWLPDIVLYNKYVYL